MAKNKTALSLIELIIFVMFLGILAAISVPKMTSFIISKQKAETFANQVVTDLRWTRRLAISDAATNTDGYALNMTGGGPYTGYEIENLNTSTTITNGTFSIDSDITCNGGASFQFGPLGNRKPGSATQLTVTGGEKTFTIDITLTGMVKCTEN